MAQTTIKSTFSLDVETVRRLERLARAWGVNKSQVLRQVIRHAPTAPPDEAPRALALLKRIHAGGGRSASEVKQWAKRVRDERKATAAKRQARTGQARRGH
ncbi:MAG: ribbon-helix-helix protein, CopG family [Phycisphaeraceae bacterium]|nr:ribbon-helix-helix protein, CopG family [Phycisphaeraceae bacterium]